MRINFCKFLLLLVVLVGSFTATAQASNNILLIIADDYGLDASTLYNSSPGAQIARPLENRFMRETGKKYDGAYPGTYPLVGTPDDVAAEMVRMHEAGLAGCSVAFLDYLAEIPAFVAEVLPRLERLGLRAPVTPG